MHRQDSNPQSQQASGRKHTPSTVRPLGTAININRGMKQKWKRWALWGYRARKYKMVIVCKTLVGNRGR